MFIIIIIIIIFIRSLKYTAIYFKRSNSTINLLALELFF